MGAATLGVALVVAVVALGNTIVGRVSKRGREGVRDRERQREKESGFLVRHIKGHLTASLYQTNIFLLSTHYPSFLLVYSWIVTARGTKKERVSRIFLSS